MLTRRVTLLSYKAAGCSSVGEGSILKLISISTEKHQTIGGAYHILISIRERSLSISAYIGRTMLVLLLSTFLKLASSRETCRYVDATGLEQATGLVIAMVVLDRLDFCNLVVSFFKLADLPLVSIFDCFANRLFARDGLGSRSNKVLGALRHLFSMEC